MTMMYHMLYVFKSFSEKGIECQENNIMAVKQTRKYVKCKLDSR